MSLPAAVLWDCDGTLLDSETVTLDAMRAALADLGHQLTEDVVAAAVGHPWPHTRQLLVDGYGLRDAELERFRADVRRRAGPALDDPSLVHPDVVATLDALVDQGVPMAVVTSSGRGHLDRVLRLAPLAGRFAVRVARQDTARHKPDPTPYVTALAALSHLVGRALPAGDVTVVEDSVAGVAAGLAAGCWTVAVDRGAGIHDLSAAHRVVTRVDPAVLAPAGSGAPQPPAADSTP